MKTAALLLLATSLHAQTFEVASIKPSPNLASLTAEERMSRCATRIDAARVEMGCASLSTLIAAAYRIEPYQLSGPDWMATTRFDVLAKLPDGAAKEQVPAMLQALLAERFKLTVRRESTEQPVYALLVAKGGPKLKPAAPDAGTAPEPFPNGSGGRILLRVNSSGENGWQTYSVLNGRVVFDADKITMPQLATVLMGQVEIPVIDRTGLSGAYAVSLEVPNANPRRPGMPLPAGRRGGDPGSPSDQAATPSGTDIVKSVETLGLRLERTKAAIAHITVERAEKLPTEN